MAYGQQHFLVWFFIPATPSYTSFSDFSPSVTRSFIRKKLFFENFMLWYLCCRIWNYGDYGPLGYDLSCRGSHCSVSSTFIRIHLILLCIFTSEYNPSSLIQPPTYFISWWKSISWPTAIKHMLCISGIISKEISKCK